MHARADLTETMTVALGRQAPTMMRLSFEMQRHELEWRRALTVVRCGQIVHTSYHCMHTRKCTRGRMHPYTHTRIHTHPSTLAHTHSRISTFTHKHTPPSVQAYTPSPVSTHTQAQAQPSKPRIDTHDYMLPQLSRTTRVDVFVCVCMCVSLRVCVYVCIYLCVLCGRSEFRPGF